MHRGLLILPNAATERAVRLLDAIIDVITAQDEVPASHMINRAVTADADGSIRTEVRRPARRPQAADPIRLEG